MRNELTFWRDSAFRPLMELQRDIDRLFEGYRTGPSDLMRSEGREWFMPACDVEETDDHYLVRMDVPGVNKDDISIELKDGELSVSGVRSTEHKSEEKNVRVMERSYGSFARTFTLPAGVDPERIEASHDNGVLTLAIPKAEATKPRQIKIGNGKSFVGKLPGKKEEPVAQKKPA